MPGTGVVSMQRCIASSMRSSRARETPAVTVSLMVGFRQKLTRKTCAACEPDAPVFMVSAPWPCVPIGRDAGTTVELPCPDDAAMR